MSDIEMQVNQDAMQTAAKMPETAQPIGSEQLKKLTRTLEKYKSGKVMLEKRVVQSENWW